VANDGLVDSMPATVTLSVLSATANRPPGAPSVTPLLAVLTHDAGEPVSVTLTATAGDPDGDPITYEFAPDATVPATASLAPAGERARVTSSSDGVFVFYVTAQDTKGATGPFTMVKVSVGQKVSAGAVDADKDGYPAGADCDDANPNVFPGQKEICGDGIDQ